MARTVAFFCRHFTERGTEVATFNYAHFNEVILGNRSIIVHFSKATQRKLRLLPTRECYPKFATRFTTVEINEIAEMKAVIEKYDVVAFYTRTHGGPDFYHFENEDIWRGCVTIKHCVFTMSKPEGTHCCALSECIARKCRRCTVPPLVLPTITSLSRSPRGQLDRAELGIPADALVFGYHGGPPCFKNPAAIQAVNTITRTHAGTPIFFLFMNTERTFTGTNVVCIPKTLDDEIKSRFIQTCSAMLHARMAGETFGNSCAEFACHGKPVIVCKGLDNAHIEALGEAAILYTDYESLSEILCTFDKVNRPPVVNTWYQTSCTPEAAMQVFNTLLPAVKV